MTITFNSEQNDCIEAAATSTDNLLIEALAGAAKTTTLVEMAGRLRGSVLSVAFNKKIADEMAGRMPKTVECRTLNSLGHRILGQNLGKKLFLGDGKLVSILKETIEDYSGEEREWLRENFADVLQILKGSKNHGHVPDTCAKELGPKCQPLMTDEEFFEMLPEPPSALVREVTLRVLRESWKRALGGYIDYADQLLLPTTVKMMFPVFQNVLVDEAQDLSELNHRMLEKLAKGRIIAVGDSKQAIYAFRGAHTSGMPLLAKRFNMRTLHLSTTFRCPEAICQHVLWHVPRIRSWEGNPNNPGEVRYMNEGWSFDDVPDGSAIICRNNAPLFTTAIRMLRAGRRPQVWGNDIAAALVRDMEKLGPGSMRREDGLRALSAMHREKEAKLRKESAKANLADRIACIRVFLEDAETLAGAITFAQTVLNASGKVDLCTGHKSKGHEWEDVFFLDEFLVKDGEQEDNLRYVIATRAKKRLTYLDSGKYLEGAME